MSDTIITVENLSKKYLVGHQNFRLNGYRYVALRDVIRRETRNLARKTLDLARGRQVLQGDEVEDFWALKNVSFEVKRGEVLGIIGRNGAGKSTLLKILSRITEPTEGRVTLRGRAASLLEVGTGFHPELSGRENIFLNGAILGMTRSEITKKFDEIVAFAEVEKFLDTPVKHFSSGMYVRLAFSVAAHLEAEILLVDEVLAVGDHEFQQKCLRKISNVAGSGRTILLVSHNMAAVNNIAEQCIFMEGGRLHMKGTTDAVVRCYIKGTSVEHRRNGNTNVGFYRRDNDRDLPVTIESIQIGGDITDLNAPPTVEIGDDLEVAIQINSDVSLPSAHVTIILKNDQREIIGVFFSLDTGTNIPITLGRQIIAAKITNLPLSPGEYIVDVGVGRSLADSPLDVIIDFPLFRVIDDGKIAHWPGRPRGLLHSRSIDWTSRPPLVERAAP
jgi:lipopolysaccharide transport system ATP-binding protein